MVSMGTRDTVHGSLARSRTPHRLLVLSNRLPELRTPAAPGAARARSVGGLVSALEHVLAARSGLWLGWSGVTVETPAPTPVIEDQGEGPVFAWVDFSPRWRDRYYDGFCNRGLWPLFHSFPGRVRFVDDEWSCYTEVNRAFAQAARDLVERDVPIWVHDYHLLLVARELRRLGHRGPIGLFLHVPFPGMDLFSMVPWADVLIAGMLEFDLVGFQTDGHLDSFLQCVRMLSCARLGDDAIEHGERRTCARVLPIGVVPEGFQEPPEPDIAEEVEVLLRSIAQTRLILGVDRLDYTKGIPERLHAFGVFLEGFPEWRNQVSLVQVSVPSRTQVPEYAEERTRVEQTVGRINGEFGETHWTPIRYLYRSYKRNQLAQFYRAAAVGYVTPLRDGMNLVAKEYVAAQDPANPGVLLLSRFAGAARELDAAVLTNPYHPDGMARDLDRALRMPLEERCSRHARLQAAVSGSTAITWAEAFLAALEQSARRPPRDC
jgi:alpha,alpha-trehalose-phosphate synthase [UDP-forming]